MADAILISCPECNKRLRTPPNLQGKKIRCKGCGHVFTAKALGSSKEDKAKSGAKSTSRANDQDFKADLNPYTVLDTEFAYRCPHCAAEMESEDAIICLHCGYNTQTRERHHTRELYPTTGMDYFMWLLPGVACAVAVLALIGFIVFLYVWLGEIAEANKDAWWNFGIKASQVWGTVFSLFALFFAGKFAIKRLIFHPTPPEKIKKR